jgi:5-methylcytosine-specific restriction endonuclease McrA
MLDYPVLILNQNFEPLNVCRVRRAIVLILQDKAEVIEDNSSVIRSPSFSMISPSVVRLAHMVKRPRPQVRLTRRRVFIRDQYTCQYCGRQTREVTLDHVLPRYMGGEHSWDNVVTACKACNQQKAGRTPREARMKLLRQPFQPPPADHYLVYPFCAPPEWQKYLEF